MDEGLNLRDLLDEAGELLAGVAADGRVLACSRALRRTLGWSEDQVPGVDLVAAAAPESRASLQSLLARAVAGEQVVGEVLLTTCEGAPRRFSARLRGAADGRAAYVVLREEPARFHADLAGVLDESTSIALLAADTQGRITLFNRGAERICGVRAADVIGRHYTALPIDPEESSARIRQLEREFGRKVTGLEAFVLPARERGSDELTTTVRRPDGSRVIAHSVLSPLRGPAGEITGYVAIVRDITAEREAQAAHDRLHGKLRATLYGSLDSIALYEAVRDAGGAIVDFALVDCNPQTEALAGLPRDSLLGARLSQLGPPGTMEPFIRKYERVVVSGETLDEEYESHSRLLPGPLWLRHQVVRVGDGVAVTSRDITKRKLAEIRLRDSEERLQLALEATDDELWDWNVAAGRVAYTRGCATATATYPAAELDSAVHPDDRPAFHAALQSHLSGETLLFRCEYRVRAGDGGHRWVLGRGRVVAHDAAGRPARLICTQTDISARRQQEDALRRAVAAAEAASRAKSEFLAHVSHEIRTPMNGILGMVELALRDDPPPRSRDRLLVIQDSARSLLAIINDLLDVAKIEAGKLELMPVAFDLPAELRRTTLALRPRAEQQGLRLELDVSGDVPTWVVGDPDRLRQVLVNLIGNAIKFTEHGEVRVSAEAAFDPGERVRVRFAVRDTGIGIPLDRLAAIFAPFEQADASTTRRFGGTGLGLTIASRLVRLMGGEIAVESEVGVGSTFSFEAEFARASEARREEPRPLAPDAAQPLRILLAEDNRINQLVASEMLQRAGHQVTVVGDGEAALEAVARASFDLVLMDVQMPEMDGWEATAAIRRHPDPHVRKVPIVAMTARATEADRLRSLERGMDGFLTKPLVLPDLHAALAAIASRKVSHAPAVDDWDAVLERVGGSRPLLARLIDMACEEAPMLAGVLRSAAPHDPEELRRIAHRAAGTAAMFSAGRAVALARALEASAPTAPPAERIAQAELVAEELARLAAELAAHRSGMPEEHGP